jgi:membrane-bound lytic murein transglycosylase B
MRLLSYNVTALARPAAAPTVPAAPAPAVAAPAVAPAVAATPAPTVSLALFDWGAARTRLTVLTNGLAAIRRDIEAKIASAPAPKPKPAPKPVDKLLTMSVAKLQELGRTNKKAFLEALRPAAEEGEKKYGVPAEVTMAQAALETGWGRSIIEGYNLFGMKGTGPAGTVKKKT